MEKFDFIGMFMQLKCRSETLREQLCPLRSEVI